MIGAWLSLAFGQTPPPSTIEEMTGHAEVHIEIDGTQWTVTVRNRTLSMEQPDSEADFALLRAIVRSLLQDLDLTPAEPPSIPVPPPPPEAEATPSAVHAQVAVLASLQPGLGPGFGASVGLWGGSTIGGTLEVGVLAPRGLELVDGGRMWQAEVTGAGFVTTGPVRWHLGGGLAYRQYERLGQAVERDLKPRAHVWLGWPWQSGARAMEPGLGLAFDLGATEILADGEEGRLFPVAARFRLRFGREARID